MRSMLSGGDRRSIGRAAEVADLVRRHPQGVFDLVKCLYDEDARVSMRAADALEKVSRNPAISLQSHKTHLLNLLMETTQQELKWHLAVILPRLELTTLECRHVAETLRSYLEESSSIVRTFAMQGLADLTDQYPALRPGVTDTIRVLTRTGTPAMRARGRKLLQKLDRDNG